MRVSRTKNITIWVTRIIEFFVSRVLNSPFRYICVRWFYAQFQFLTRRTERTKVEQTRRGIFRRLLKTKYACARVPCPYAIATNSNSFSNKPLLHMVYYNVENVETKVWPTWSLLPNGNGGSFQLSSPASYLPRSSRPRVLIIIILMIYAHGTGKYYLYIYSICNTGNARDMSTLTDVLRIPQPLPVPYEL